MTDREKLVAACGIDCYYCEFYGNNMTEKHKELVAIRLRKTKDEIQPCKGCREQKGCLIQPVCSTYYCAIAKDINFCSDCRDFPCNKLQPTANLAEKVPHNYKVYNLCRIKAVGIEKFVNEESKLIRERYFNGKLVIGSGPQLN